MDNVTITRRKQENLFDFLEMNNFQVDHIEQTVYKVQRDDDLPVFMNVNSNTIYFEVDLGNITSVNSKEAYFGILDLNTEILPVSLGINTTNPDDPRLVLVESREIQNLDDNELLSVFDAFELATEKVWELLSKYMEV